MCNIREIKKNVVIENELFITVLICAITIKEKKLNEIQNIKNISVFGSILKQCLLTKVS